MRDREPSPGKEGHVKLTLDSGEVLTGKLEMDDDPVEAGTPWSTEAVLQDLTAQLHGFDPGTATPNDVFLKLALGKDQYGYSIHVQTGSGHPLSGVTVSGIQTLDGGPCITDENGDTFGIAGSPATISVTSPYSDYQSFSQELTPTSVLYNFTVSLVENPLPSEMTISSTTSMRFSPDYAEMDICAVGAGGGGLGGQHQNGGGGGAVENLLGSPIDSTQTYQFQVGSGGYGADTQYGNQSAGNGGASKVFKGSENILTANGGNGGSQSSPGAGNGNGGSGQTSSSGSLQTGAQYNGGNGSGYKFNDPSLGVLGGGGGAGGAMSYSHLIAAHLINTGGSPNGGRGACSGMSGENGKFPGGGGGGGSYDLYSGTYGSGGSGGAGIIYLRLRKRGA